jgi:hypothetical protein
METSIRAEGDREGHAEIPSGESFIMGEGANSAARNVDVSEPSSECVVSVSFARDALEIMDVWVDLALFDVEVNARLCAEFVEKVEEDNHVLHGVGYDCDIVRVPFPG